MHRNQALTVHLFLHPGLEGCERMLRVGEREIFLPLHWQPLGQRFLLILLLVLLYSIAYGQDRGRITGTKCIVSGASPVLMSLRDADVSGGGAISWQKANNKDFTGTIGVDVITIAGAFSQSYTDGPIATSTFYRRILTPGGGGPTLYSDTIKVTVAGVISDPTFSPQVGTDIEICQKNTSFNVLYKTTNSPDKYSIIWSPAAITQGFQDVYNEILPEANPDTKSFSVAVPSTVNAGTFSGTLIALNTTTGCTVSNGSQITVNALPVISVQPANTVQNICLNGSSTDLSITAATPGGVLTTTSVRWYSNVTNSNSGGSVVATHPAPPATDTYTPQTSVANALYYYAVVTNSKSCVRTSDVSGLITINAIPSAPAVSNNGPVCVGATLSLTTATLSGASYSWTGPNGFTAALQNPSILTTSISESGTYSLTVTVSGCTSAASSTTVTVKSTPSTPSAANSGAVCVGTPLQLTTASVSGAVYTWTGPGGFSSVSQNPSVPTTSTAESGTYSLTVTVNGCTSAVSSTTATVNAIPAAPTVGNGGAVCVGTSLQLTAVSVIGATYAWTGPGGFTSAVQNPLVPTTSTAESGTYSLTVTVNGCTSAVSSTMARVNALPSIAGISNLCAGTSTTLTGSGTAAAVTPWASSNSTIATVGSNGLVTGLIAGPTTITYTDNNGCQQTASVVVNGLPTATITASGPTVFCAGGSVNLTAGGGLSYNWSTGAGTSIISVANSGTFTVTATDGNGCKGTSAATLVTVNPLPTASITASGPTSFCAGGSVSLTASAGAAYLWSTGATSRSISMNSSGNPTVTITDINGCSATSVPAAVTVNPLPNLVIINPAAVCAPGTVNLTAAAVTAGSTAGTVFTYFTDAATSIAFTSPTTTGVAGTYYIKGTLPTGCSSSGAVTVVINNPPSLTTQNPTAVCAPQTVNLGLPTITQGSDNGLVYAYFTDAALSAPLLNPTAVGSSGVYYIKANAPGSACSAALPVTVTVHPIPTGTLQTPAVNYVCSGSSLQLNATDAFAYQWLLNQTPITGATNAVYEASGAGVYSVRFISQQGCVREATNTLRIDQLVKPVLRLQLNSRCVAAPISFSNLSSYASSGGINWLWDFGDGALANNFSSTHTYSTAGNYTVSLTANNLSCPSFTETITAAIYIDSARVPVRYPTVKAVAGKAFPLTARSLGALYRWQPGTGLNSTSVQSPMATLNNDIEYTVTITNSASCTTTDTVAVKLVFDGNIFVGNGFTPNGDGVNDRCYPILTGVRSLVYFKIYNRWGNLVFQTNDASPQNGWDGKYNGRLQPVGTYTWIAEAVDGNGNVFKRNGNLLLIN